MYELLFWNYKEGIYLNHHEVYENLIDNVLIDGLEDIPQEVISNRITSIFKNWNKVDANSWENPNGKGAFQVKTNSQSVIIYAFQRTGIGCGVSWLVTRLVACPECLDGCKIDTIF